MKTTATASALLGLFATALFPCTEATPIVKRADPNEAASIGFATLNGGTTGGAGGATTRVSTLSALQKCASSSGPAICILTGPITGADTVTVTSDKTILGADSTAKLTGVGLTIKGKSKARVSNVIVRNLSIDKVLAENGDAIAIQYADNVWVDHVDLQGDRTQPDKDKYDGLFDVTHASDFVTLTSSKVHNHWKASLIGHSDSNGAEDTGHLTVTFAHNYVTDINSRTPSLRFGTAHIFNNFFEDIDTGVNSRLGAQALVEGNVFSDVSKPIFSVDNDGFAISRDNDFGGASNTAPEGNLTLPYSASVSAVGTVKSAVLADVGPTLTF